MFVWWTCDVAVFRLINTAIHARVSLSPGSDDKNVQIYINPPPAAIVLSTVRASAGQVQWAVVPTAGHVNHNI